jgi:hypothetical protein
VLDKGLEMIRQLQQKIQIEVKEWRTLFVTCLLLNLLAYSGLIVNSTYAVDDYGHIFSAVDHTAHGRWLAGFIFNTLLQKSLMPTLAPIIAIVCYILTGIGLCKLWSTPKKTSMLVVLLWSLHPYLLEIYHFRIATVNCALAYLIAVNALLLVSRSKWRIALAVLLFYLALSVYQTVVGFVIAVIMIQVLLKSDRSNFSVESVRDCAKLFLRYVLMLGLSVVVYSVLTRLIFMICDVKVNARIQGGFISDIEQLKAKLSVIAIVLFVRLGPIKEFILPFAGKLAVFLIHLLALLGIFCRKPFRMHNIYALVWVCLIPLGAISFLLPLDGNFISWRTWTGIVVFFVGMFALTQQMKSQLIRRAGMLLGTFLVVSFILSNNTVLYKQHLVNQRDEFMANRIITKIQSLDDYQPGMELAIVGCVSQKSFSKDGKSKYEIITEYAKHCSTRKFDLAKSAFETDWSKYAIFLDYLQVDFRRPSKETWDDLNKWAVGRKAWPDPESVFIKDDVAVIVLGPLLAND